MGEEPDHAVYLDVCRIDKFEVTNALYKKGGDAFRDHVVLDPAADDFTSTLSSFPGTTEPIMRVALFFAPHDRLYALEIREDGHKWATDPDLFAKGEQWRPVHLGGQRGPRTLVGAKKRAVLGKTL